MSAAPPVRSGESVTRSVADDRPLLPDDAGRPGRGQGLDRGGDATWIADEMLAAAVVAGAWFAIGAGVALMLAGGEAPIVDIAIALAVAVAGTLATLALLAHVATDEA